MHKFSHQFKGMAHNTAIIIEEQGFHLTIYTGFEHLQGCCIKTPHEVNVRKNPTV